MTWEELRVLVGADSPTGDDWFGVVRDEVKIRVERVEAFGEPWVLLAAHVGPEKTMSGRDALVISFRMALASIGIDDGQLYVRATRPLAALTPEEIERTITFLTSEAARLRTWRPGPTPHPVE